MVQVTCEKTGLTFEAKTSRTRNHPAIMNALSKAEKDGFYRNAITVLQSNKGRLGTIEEYVSLVENAGNAKVEAASAKFREEYAAKESAKEARREQEVLRQKLTRHGYTFEQTMYNAGDDENDNYSVGLFGPDGGRVTVEQALAEIENSALVKARIEAVKSKEEAHSAVEQEEETVIEEQPVSALPENPTPVNEPDLFLFNVLFGGTSGMDEQPPIVPGSKEDKKYQAAKTYWEQRKKGGQ